LAFSQKQKPNSLNGVSSANLSVVNALKVFSTRTEAGEIKKAKSQKLSPQEPHHPARHEYSAHKHREAIQPVADLLARSAALSDTENNRSKHREQHGGSEM
jgi:hypothetical protein